MTDDEEKSMGLFRMLCIYLRLSLSSKSSRARAVFESHGGTLPSFSLAATRQLVLSELSRCFMVFLLTIFAMSVGVIGFLIIKNVMPRPNDLAWTAKIINDDGTGNDLAFRWDERLAVQILARTRDPLCRASSCKPSQIAIVDIEGLSRNAIELMQKTTADLKRGSAMIVRSPGARDAHRLLIATPNALAEIHTALSISSIKEPSREASAKLAFAEAVLAERKTGANERDAMLAGDKAMERRAASFDSMGNLPAAERLGAPRRLSVDVSAARLSALVSASANLDDFAARQFMARIEPRSTVSEIVVALVVFGSPLFLLLWFFATQCSIYNKMESLRSSLSAAAEFLSLSRAAKGAPRASPSARGRL